MSFYQLFSDEPKDKVSVLNKQKQMTIDSQNMSFEEWSKKWGGMDEEDTRAFMPGRVYEGKETYKIFQSNDPKVFDQRIGVEQKRIERVKKEDEMLTTDAAQKAGFLKTYMQNKSTLDRLNTEIPTKYNYTPGEDLNPVSYIRAGMIKEAEERIKNKQGIGLTGDEKNENVCIRGVCTLAANQGVDFKKGFGQYKDGMGIDIDETGRVIPQFNQYWSKDYANAGFEKLPKGERPKPGDFAQYYNKEGIAKHMEMVLADKGNNLETFNNYELYNTYGPVQRYEPVKNTGRSVRAVGNTINSMMSNNWGTTVDDTEYYRLSADAAAAALAKNQGYQTKVKGKQAFESSEDFKLLENTSKFMQQNKDVNILGDDQGLVQDIIKGVSSGGKYEDVLKSVVPKAKNAKLVERVIKNLYQ